MKLYIIILLEKMLKGLLFWRMESISQQIAPKLRAVGQQMFRSGMENQGAMAHSDRIVPSLRCVPTAAGVYPKLLSVCVIVSTIAN